ncbi:MAG: chemotaxis protein CheD [Spirochaetales bacterium]|nr:chemotaxis protein CheD [Spirochaetales bacterium]
MFKSYNTKFKKEVVTIYSGECYVSTSGEILSTILGSCVAVCLYDLRNGIGGMNHFMLPTRTYKTAEYGQPLKYGDYAIEHLIEQMLKLGSDFNNIKAKIFGGGKVIYHNGESLTIGEVNINYAKSFLNKIGIKIEKEDIGSDKGRNITFFTETSDVFVKKVHISNNIQTFESINCAI